MAVRTKRLQKEMNELASAPEGVSAGPSGDNLYEWDAFIVGPPDTPYAGGLFKLKITFPDTYPFTAPRVTFVTPIYHCNVSTSGSICLDILNSKWSPVLTVVKVLQSIQILMAHCNPSSALQSNIATQYQKNRAEFEKRAREHTLRHASPK